MIAKKISLGKKSICAYQITLDKKNLILFVGKKGYAMCGYLNIAVSNKFSEAAIKFTGAATISAALKMPVFSVSREGYRIGIRKNQQVKEALNLIA